MLSAYLTETFSHDTATLILLGLAVPYLFLLIKLPTPNIEL